MFLRVSSIARFFRAARQASVLALLALALPAPAQDLLQSWAATPTGPLGSPTNISNIFAPQHVAALDAAGNIIRVGFVVTENTSPPRTAMYAAKYSIATGAELWRFTREGSQADLQDTSLLAVAIDAAGNALVSGTVRTSTGTHHYVAKLSGADGTAIWEQVGVPSETSASVTTYGDDIALDASGNPTVIGTQSYSTGGFYAMATKLDGATGAIVWHRIFNTSDFGTDQAGVAVAVDSAGDAVLATLDPPAGSHLMKLAGATGATVWNTPWTWTVPDTAGPELQGMVLDPLGKAVLFGKGVAKFGADGSFDWVSPLAASDSTSRVWGATFASNGDVIATGATLNGTQMTTVRLLSASGGLVWSNDWHDFDTVHGGQGGRSVAMDANGDVVATGGLIQDINIGISTFTGKLNPATGALKGYQIYQNGNPPSVVLVRPGAVYADGPQFVVKYADESTATVAPAPPKVAGTMPRKIDFDFDDRADIAWRSSAGFTYFWLMNGTTPTAQGMNYGPAPAPRAFGDLNGDAKTDFIFRFPDGGYGFWAVSGHDVQTVNNNWLPAGSGWDVMGTGRFDADTISDILWRNANGSYGMWLLKDPNTGCCVGDAKASGLIATPGAGFEVVQIGDFDGDGKDDLLWRHPDGRVFVALMDGMTTTASVQVLGAGTGWTPVLLGDFNGDGKADIVWRHDNGSYGIWLMNGTSIASYASVLGAGTGWTATMVGDLDGDGKHDILWAHTNGSQGAWLMDGTSIKSYGSLVGPGSAWQVVRTDDFDFDGKADLLWRNTSTNQYGIWLMDGLAYKSYGALTEPTDWTAEP